MRWIASLSLVLLLTGAVRATGPDDQYLGIYNELLQGDTLQKDGQVRAAAVKYLEAQKRLQSFKADYPDWNPDVVAFRLEYLADKMQALGSALPAATAPTEVAAPGPSGSALEPQIAGLQEQVRALTAENGELENKLKEALSVQPAAVSPVELAKREQEVVALTKERDLLNVALDQAKGAQAAGAEASNSKLAEELAAAQHQAGDANKKLEDASRELAALKAAPPIQTVSPETARIAQERDQLKEELAARTKDLADAEARGDQAVLTAQAQLKETQAQRDQLKEELAARTKDLADAEARGDQAGLTAQAQLKEALAQRDELQKKMDAAATTTAAGNAEIDRLRARLAVLEAKATPYTPEELAALHSAPSRPPAQLPDAAAAPLKRPHVAHSAKDLPPGAGPLMADALRDSMEHDFTHAEEIYKEILRQDENNVYVLAYLANAQFAEGHLEECGTTVNKALAADPDDPASLYLLGILRYRQERLDDALDALSRSAQLNSTNPGTQNYLGCVLADKGQRPAAESALRKALVIEPDYPDAHYNLAFIYATEKPPSPELARWHYKRAVDLGHAKSPQLEGILAAEK
jgi:tetratricopeptide (TPR) repeat protein